MRDEAERRIGHLHPKIEVTAEMAKGRPDLKPLVGKKLTVIAWLWARTVKSPNPAFAHVEVPLASTFMLSTKSGKEVYVEPVIEDGGYRFTVRVGKPTDAEGAKNGTKLARGANFQCVMSGTPIASKHIYGEANAGRMGARLMAIVAEGQRGRVYLAPTPEHEAAALEAKPEWKPDVVLPVNPRDFKTPNYGLILDEVLAEQEGDFDADSRWALAWFEQSGFSEGEYGVAETLSKAKNTSLGGMVEAGIVESKRGKVRLLPPDELRGVEKRETRSEKREMRSEKREGGAPLNSHFSFLSSSAWLMVHHLIRVLESDGESAAAALAAKLGARAEVARELAYRLYTIAERKKRAQEALRYNALVQSWAEIGRLARESGTRRAEQTTLFEGDDA